jgi:hypothetical protein
VRTDLRERDGRESAPRPPEPQSDDIGCHRLPRVAESAYLSQSSCSRLCTIAARCALGGVNGGVKRVRQLLPWSTLPYRVPHQA